MRLGIQDLPDGKILALSIVTMKRNYKIRKTGAMVVILLMLLNIIRKHPQR